MDETDCDPENLGFIGPCILDEIAIAQAFVAVMNDMPELREMVEDMLKETAQSPQKAD